MNKEQKKKLTKIFRIIVIILLLFAIFRGVFVLFVLIILSLSMSFFVNRYKLRNVGIELVTLTGVLAGMKYGPLTGFIIAFILISYHMLAGGFIAQYLIWVIPAYSLAGAISGFFPATDIVKLGVYLSIAINLNNTIFTAITSPGYLPKYLPFVVSNIIFNAIVFTAFARPLLLLLI